MKRSIGLKSGVAGHRKSSGWHFICGAFLLAMALLGGEAWANSCTTTFPVTANPIAGECGSQTWKNGGAEGLDWSNIQVTGGSKAWGTMVPVGLGQNDSVAILNGSWTTNQMAQATVIFNGSVGNENELFLHGTVAAHNLTGYEVTCSLGYVFVAKWLGPLNSNSQLVFDNTKHCSNGDVFTAVALTSGSNVTITAYVNGVQAVTATDSSSAFTGGAPGLGQWIGSSVGDNNANGGESDYFASDQVFKAATASRTDVNAVINGGTHTAVDGDVILIPSGTSTWTSGITITGAGITIMGLGKPKSIGSLTGAGTNVTTLTNNANAPYFIFTGLTFGKTARVSTLQMNSSNPATNFNVTATVEFIGTCTSSGCPQARLDNITYGTDNWGNNLADGGFVSTDNVYAVLDHNTASEFGNRATNAVGPPFVQVAYSGWLGVGDFGDNSYAAPDSFGTGSAMYLENNSFNFVRGTENDVATADGKQGGARYVCRFNAVTNMSGTGLCSAHGTGWLGRPRGQRQIEAYYNTVSTNATNGCDAVTGISSGTGLFFSNSINTSSVGCNKFVGVDVARFIQNLAPWNSCDGTQPWDKVPFSSSSVCFDQPGRGGLGALLQNTTPVLAAAPGTPCTTPGQCYPNAPLAPIYEAGDTSTAPNVSQGISAGAGSGHIVANVDYYGEVSQLAQTSTTFPFNGTAGTGYGTLVRRPVNCTIGVGYWATDTGSWNVSGSAPEGTLYICTSTNIWSTSYTPFVYPHPLISGAVSPTGGQPTVSISPSSLTFASQLLNTQSPTQAVTIQNTSASAVLTIASLQVPAQYFQGGGTCVIPGTLAAGASCNILIGFQPTQAGTVTGSLCFTDNGTGSPQCIPLSGVGTPTTASFTPNPLAFGPHTVGSTSAPLMATLTNTGAAVLTLNCSGCGIGITNSSIFSFVGTTCGAQLGPGAFCTVSISFSPPSSGAFSGTMTYTTDAANSPNVITMTGSGGTSHWVIGRVGIGAMRWGRNAGLPTPNLYFARTDQCNGSGTGGDTGCTGQAAMNFFGRNTSAGQAYTPIDVPPLLNTGNPLTGQNVCGIDTDFHTKICRVTDYSSMSALGSGFNTGSGGDVQNWAADTSGYIVYTAGGGQPVLMSFTPGTMASSASQIGGIVGTSDCSGAVYFGTNCKSFVTGNISYSPSDGSAIYEMDLGPAPTHIYLNKLTLSKAGAPSTWSFSRSMLFDFGSAGGSTHCLPSDFAASYVGSFNISADSSTFAFAIGDNGQNGQRDYTITGVIASGSFTKGETLTQAVTGAVTVVDTCGALACTSPFAIRAYTGTPDSTHDWVGTGGGHFTPTGLPVLQHYGASFLILYDTGQTGCRVLKTFGPGHDGFGPMVIDGDWGPTGNVLMGTDKQATTCNATNTGQTPNCYPNTVPLGTSAGPTLLDTMELHNAGPTNDKKYVVFSGSDIQACTTVGGRSTCYCASSNLCEAYTWEGATLNIRPNLPEGHNVKGSLGAYKGTNYAFFTYHDPYIKLSNLLTVTIPVDQHGASGNLNSVDAEPVAFAAQQSCGTATGPGNLACDPNYGTITGTPGNYPYYDEFVAVENQGAYCSVNPTIGPICLTPPAQHCNYGAGANTTACAYRFAHCFNSGTNWNFSTQNCIANISPNGDYAMLATDWFPTGSATDGLNRGFGCTNGDDGITPGHLCLPNLDANGKGTAYTTSASKSGSTITFISTDTTVGIMKPTVGAKLTVSGFAVETRYNATWTVATSPGGGVWTASSTATAFAADSGGKANWDCGNGALASTPCPRGDIVVINLRTAGTVH